MMVLLEVLLSGDLGAPRGFGEALPALPTMAQARDPQQEADPGAADAGAVSGCPARRGAGLVAGLVPMQWRGGSSHAGGLGARIGGARRVGGKAENYNWCGVSQKRMGPSF